MNTVEDIYGKEIDSIVERVHNCYKNLQGSKIKFTDDMVLLIKLDLIDHSDYRVSEIYDIKDLSPVTKRYLKECKKRLDKYDPTDIKNNLKQMDLV